MSIFSIGVPEQTQQDLRYIAEGSRLAGIWRLMSGYRWIYLLAAICLGIGVTGRTASLFIIRYFIDTYLPDPAAAYPLWVIVGGYILLALVIGLLTFTSGTLAAHTAEGIAQRLRNYMLDHIQRLPFAYHDEVQTGEMVQRVTSDLDAVRRFFASQAIESSRILFMLTINFIAIWTLNPQLALVSIAIIPVVLILSIYFFRLVSNAYEKYQEQEAVLTTTLQENLTGVRVVKAFARQPYEEAKFEDANINKFRLGKRLLFMHSLYWPFTDILCGAQMLIGYAVGAYMTINGTITVGDFIAYSGMVLLIIWPIRGLGRLVVDMSRGLVSFQRLKDVIRANGEVMDEPDFAAPERLRGEIVFENVGFTYVADPDAAPLEPVTVNGANSVAHTAASAQNGSAQNGSAHNGHATPAADSAEAESRPRTVALNSISFQVQPGQRIALMGAAGAGKTTLVNLLPRFYDYTSGRILLDGKELKGYSRRYLREQIGIVEQEPFLFSRTVRDNITYSVGTVVSQEQVEEAAKAAAIHDVILDKLPEGYNTLIGERGTTLSGGQKQRVAIARTLLKNPRILILDDSTSAVDTETEAAIRGALENLMQNRTTFIIAHRIQSVMTADLILVLNRGRIVQAGTHDELLEQDGMYRRIFLAQTRIEDELQKELNRV